MNYKIEHLNLSIVRILDDTDGCIYLIKGFNRALVIDTGMCRENLKDIIDDLVETDYDVVLTHGHIDHIGRSQEFNNVYMSFNDLNVYEEHTHLSNNPNDQFNTVGLCFKKSTLIKDMPHSFHLGNKVVYCIPCFGHTPGSYIFVDTVDHVVFTGDAIGSGCGVWMQVDHALSIYDYCLSLKYCLQKLEELNVDDSWLFLGGHAYQEYQSKVNGFNKLDINLLKDMITLCEKLLMNEISYHFIHTSEFSNGKPYYASYHKAEIIFTLSQL